MEEAPSPSVGDPPSRGHGFGTAPVFLAAISTILGAILFLRFGYAVGHVGPWGAVLIVLLGHLVTIPTALAISEIATNRRVEGGGEYFIISRSFGPTIGGAIGVSLYLSQAVSVAFYMIAFAEAFRPIAGWMESMAAAMGHHGPFDPRWVSVPGVILLVALVAVRGADMGVSALWVVAVVLGVSLLLFFLGSPVASVPPAGTPAVTAPAGDGEAPAPPTVDPPPKAPPGIPGAPPAAPPVEPGPAHPGIEAPTLEPAAVPPSTGPPPVAEGSAPAGGEEPPFRPDPFMLVFAIVFPAFTGMTAGVGLSGDLKDPKLSIPLGTLTATVFGMLVYMAIIWKLEASAPPQMLATDANVMTRIALWGPIIPIGLACACVSSAIGSILIAPRTMQALAADRVLPFRRVNSLLGKGVGAGNEPRTATIITGLLAVGIALAGDVDFVARIISMFFMVTYGALCAISFLEHFAARPSYRPSFRSKWYLSLLGAVMSLALMLQMDPAYALMSLVLMFTLYFVIRATQGKTEGDFAAIFHGVMTQLTRWMQLRMQKSLKGKQHGDWRPSVITFNGLAENRAAPIDMLGWICRRYGFGTYIQLVEGKLDEETWAKSRTVLEKLIRVLEGRKSAIYADTVVSPSIQSALSQTLQVPGVSGMENNTVLFEFNLQDPPAHLEEAVLGCRLAASSRMSSLVLRHSFANFGNRARIDVWITWHDYQNATLEILLAYILLGHPDWSKAGIRIRAAFPQEMIEDETKRLTELMETGRLPISAKNVEIISTTEKTDFAALVRNRSAEADLVIMGFTRARLDEKGSEIFSRYPELQDVLFVCAGQQVAIE